jgi:hypothetical protein
MPAGAEGLREMKKKKKTETFDRTIWRTASLGRTHSNCDQKIVPPVKGAVTK